MVDYFHIYELLKMNPFETYDDDLISDKKKSVIAAEEKTKNNNNLVSEIREKALKNINLLSSDEGTSPGDIRSHQKVVQKEYLDNLETNVRKFCVRKTEKGKEHCVISTEKADSVMKTTEKLKWISTAPSVSDLKGNVPKNISFVETPTEDIRKRQYRAVQKKIRDINEESVTSWINYIIDKIKKEKRNGTEYNEALYKTDLALFSSFRDEIEINLFQTRYKIGPVHIEIKRLVDSNILKENNWELYKGYLEYLAEEKIEGFLSETGTITHKTIMEIEDKLRGLGYKGVGTDIINSIIERYCIVNGKPADLTGSYEKTIYCAKCGRANKEVAGEMYCNNEDCLNPLKIKCKNCGNLIYTDGDACGACGFSFGALKKKLYGLESVIRVSLKGNDYENALSNLNHLKKEDPQRECIGEFERELSALKEFNEKKQDLKKAANNKQYCKVSQEGRTLLQIHPTDIDIQTIVNNAEKYVEAAEEIIKKAKTLPEEQEVEQYARAINICPDMEIATTFLKAHPPAPPASITVFDDDNVIKIRIDPAPAGDVKYVVVRKENAQPKGPSDGRIIADGGVSFFTDENVDPAINYYYSAFTSRFGILSNIGRCSRPIAVFPQIKKDDIRLDAFPDHIRIRFTTPKGAFVLIAKESNDGSESLLHPNRNQNEIHDREIETNKKYTYSFVAKYSIDNEIRESKKVSKSITAVKCSPPPNITIRKSEDRKFIVSSIGSGDIFLYFSQKKEDLNYISEDELRKTLQFLQTNRLGTGEREFTMSEGGRIYVYPVIIERGIAAVGTPAVASLIEGVSNVVFTPRGQVLSVSFRVPKKAIEYKILSSKHHIPTDLNDQSCSVIDGRVDQNKESEYIVKEINVRNENILYIAIFALYEYGEVSPGYFKTQILRKEKIEYSIKKKKLGGSLQITFTSDRELILENILVVVGNNAMPRSINSGTIIGTIKNLNTFKNREYDFSSHGNPDPKLIRLFFGNSEDPDRYDLIKKD